MLNLSVSVCIGALQVDEALITQKALQLPVSHSQSLTLSPTQLVDEEFDALEMFFYLLEKGILELHDNVEAYLHHLQVG